MVVGCRGLLFEADQHRLEQEKTEVQLCKKINQSHKVKVGLIYMIRRTKQTGATMSCKDNHTPITER